MSFLETVSPAAADGAVRAMYQRAEASLGYVPNWARAFSLRPEVMDGWIALVGSIRRNLSFRTYELVTLAAARALASSYCSLAHGRALAEKVLDPPAVAALAAAGQMDQALAGPASPGTDAAGPGAGAGAATATVTAAERALLAYAAKVVRAAHEIGEDDIAALRAHGYTDAEIFDAAATAAARCFFSKLLDAVGAVPDAAYRELSPELREALTVGRPIGEEPLERLAPLAPEPAGEPRR
jgi:alkylhydroperoxidase family enzyme